MEDHLHEKIMDERNLTRHQGHGRHAIGFRGIVIEAITLNFLTGRQGLWN